MFESQRNAMVTRQIESRGIVNQRVLEAMRRVPRHEFIEESSRDSAYEDHPLGIGLGQTISQPYMVALMTEALDPQPGQKVLEIGTGSGYQTAVLAELYDEVYSIERHGALSEEAGRRLNRLGYGNTHLRVGDGTQGWPEAAPFDAIMITACGPKMPGPLMNQLNTEHGRLLAPIGPENPDEVTESSSNLADKPFQELVLMHRTPEGIKRVSYGDVRFVPLIGEHAW